MHSYLWLSFNSTTELITPMFYPGLKVTNFARPRRPLRNPVRVNIRASLLREPVRSREQTACKKKVELFFPDFDQHFPIRRSRRRFQRKVKGRMEIARQAMNFFRVRGTTYVVIVPNKRQGTPLGEVVNRDTFFFGWESREERGREREREHELVGQNTKTVWLPNQCPASWIELWKLVDSRIFFLPSSSVYQIQFVLIPISQHLRPCDR